MRVLESMRGDVSRAVSLPVVRVAVGVIIVLALSVWVPSHCSANDVAAPPLIVGRTAPHSDGTVAAYELESERLRTRIRAAIDIGAMNGARVSIALLHRVTGIRASNGVEEPIETGSVSKLFIADDVLFREARGGYELGDGDVAVIGVMLRYLNDAAAEQLWNRLGDNEIVDRVAVRYGLLRTSVQSDDEWWRTRTTMTDVPN